MSTNFGQVPKYFYDRQKIAQEILAEDSIPLKETIIVKKLVASPHKLEPLGVHDNARAELLFSKITLDHEFRNISGVHKELQKMTVARPQYHYPLSLGPQRTIKERSAGFRESSSCSNSEDAQCSSGAKTEPDTYEQWTKLSPEEKQARLRATATKASPKKEPKKEITINLRHQQKLREDRACAALQRHAKYHGCQLEHSKNLKRKLSGYFCAMHAGHVVERKARNVKLLREIEAMKSKAASKGTEIGPLNIKPLSAVPMRVLNPYNIGLDDKRFRQRKGRFLC